MSDKKPEFVIFIPVHRETALMTEKFSEHEAEKIYDIFKNSYFNYVKNCLDLQGIKLILEDIDSNVPDAIRASNDAELNMVRYAIGYINSFWEWYGK